MRLDMLALLYKAASTAGITMTFEVLGDARDVSKLALDIGWAEAEYELAQKTGAPDADIKGGDVQELEQRMRNLLAAIEQKYPALLADAVKGLIGTTAEK